MLLDVSSNEDNSFKLFTLTQQTEAGLLICVAIGFGGSNEDTKARLIICEETLFGGSFDIFSNSSIVPTSVMK